MTGVCIPTPGNTTTVLANGTISSNYSCHCETQEKEQQPKKKMIRMTVNGVAEVEKETNEQA